MEIRTEADLIQEAERFANALDIKEGATVITFSGELGAGKTTFVRGILGAYGVEENVISPTFVIQRIYKPNLGPFHQVVHIDAYRLESAHELEVLGWEELLKDSSTLVLLEWPEMVLEVVPKTAQRVTLNVVDEGRILTYGT